MKKYKILLGVICLSVISLMSFMITKAEEPEITILANENCTFNPIDNGIQGEKREFVLNVNNVKPGKRIDKILYCLKSSDCNNEQNWIDVTTYDANNIVSSFQNSVGTNDMTFFISLPIAELNLKVEFVDFEPMDITYANFKLTTDDPNRYWDVYGDESYNLNNYDETFKNLVTGYKGGDIILPEDCTNNGCVLKVTLTEENYNAIVNRLNYFNNNLNQDMDPYTFLDLASMNNHLDIENYPGDSIYPYTLNRQSNDLYVETNGNTKSIYLIINKFFNYKNRSEFILGDNRNRILSEDYIGLKYLVDRKYFDETDGFLTFNEYNEYKQNAVLFYGTPSVQFVVDKVRPVSLTSTGNSNGMGTLKYQYNKIVSRDNDKYPIDNNFELTIRSYYEPEYVVPITLKNNDTKVKDITLELSRFAFGGNAGNLLIVDGEGRNCKRPDIHPDCREGNIYVSTSYRGLIDTFYADGTTDYIDSFEISKQYDGLRGAFLNHETVYVRNEEFSPWAVAIFYHDDMVIATRSFNLGELVKIEGFSEEVLPNDSVNGKVKEMGSNTFIDNYDSGDYNIYGYGLGFEKPINSIKYFSPGMYNGGNIDYTLILASKEEIIDNRINRIALFLTNGELKSDEANFPELTYGVGEGKVFEVDGRVFEELGGND